MSQGFDGCLNAFYCQKPARMPWALTISPASMNRLSMKALPLQFNRKIIIPNLRELVKSYLPAWPICAEKRACDFTFSYV